MMKTAAERIIESQNISATVEDVSSVCDSLCTSRQVREESANFCRIVKWIFADGSVIVAGDSWWDVGYSTCYCAMSSGHEGWQGCEKVLLEDCSQLQQQSDGTYRLYVSVKDSEELPFLLKDACSDLRWKIADCWSFEICSDYVKVQL